MMDVYIVEFRDEAEAVINHLQEFWHADAKFRIVSLEPSVRAFLKRQGYDCDDTTPYFDNESHSALLKTSQEIVRDLETFLQIDLGDNVTNAYTGAFIYHARFYIHLLLKIIEVLDGIHDYFSECRMVICSKKDFGSSGPSPRINSHDRYLASLCGKYCEQYHLEMAVIPLNQNVFNASNRSVSDKPIASRLLFGIAGKCYIKALKKLAKSKSVLASTSGYDLHTLVCSISESQPEITPLILDAWRKPGWYDIRDALRLSWSVMSSHGMKGSAGTIPLNTIKYAVCGKEDEISDEVYKNVESVLQKCENKFLFRGVSFYDEFRKKVVTDLVPFIVELYKQSKAMSYILDWLSPSLVISPFSIELYHALGELSFNKEIKAIVIPQKTLVKPKNEEERIEESHIGRAQITNEYEYAAAQSPLAEEYFEYCGYGGNVIKTGPLIFSRINATKRREIRKRFFTDVGENGNIVLYSPSMKSRSSCRFHVVETLDEVISTMTDVVEVIKGMEKTYLVLRLHPGGAIKRKDIEALVDIPESTIIHDRGAFEDALALADVLISYSSTCTEEAIQNGIPVILYDKWARYNHLDAPPVRTGLPDTLSPVYYVASRADLGPTLKWVLDAHSTHAIPPALLTKYVFDRDLNHNFYDFIKQVMEGSR